MKKESPITWNNKNRKKNLECGIEKVSFNEILEYLTYSLSFWDYYKDQSLIIDLRENVPYLFAFVKKHKRKSLNYPYIVILDDISFMDSVKHVNDPKLHIFYYLNIMHKHRSSDLYYQILNSGIKYSILYPN
jgi:hypothetical protein